MKANTEEKLWGKWHELILLLVGFALTTIIGSAVGYWLQNRQWEIQSAWTLKQSEIDRATKTYEDVSLAMGKRNFQAIRYVAAKKDGGSDERLTEIKKAYSEAVTGWNETLQRNIALLQRYFGGAISTKFELEIHGRFRKIHEELSKQTPDHLEMTKNLDELGGLIYNLDFDMITSIQNGTVGVFNPDQVRHAK